MRDAFGGTFMIKLFLVFIFIYVGFTAIALNYAKAFRVKNKIIDFIETNEITDLASYLGEGSGTNANKLDNILESANYTVECRTANGLSTNSIVETSDGLCYHGVLFNRVSGNSKTDKYVYYKVTTAVDWNLGVLNLILSFGGNVNDEDPLVGTWKITGETRIVNHQLVS